MEKEKAMKIFTLLGIIFSAAIVVLGIILSVFIGIIITGTIDLVATRALISGIASNIIATIIIPVLIIIFIIIGMKTLQDKETAQMIFHIINLCLSGVTLFILIMWIPKIPTLYVEPQLESLLVGIWYLVLIMIPIQSMVCVCLILRLVYHFQ